MFATSHHAAVLGQPRLTSERIRATRPGNLIQYLPLGEASGTTAVDHSGNGLDGAYTSVSLAQPGHGDGKFSTRFDGTTSFANIYSAGLNAAFTPNECSILLVHRVEPGAWQDGIARGSLSLQSTATNRIRLFKSSSVTGRFDIAIIYNSVAKTIFISPMPRAPWFVLLTTISLQQDKMCVYLNGVLRGTVNGLGTWAGALNSANCTVGSFGTVPASVFDGSLQHFALWNTPLSPADAKNLGSI